MQIGTNSLLIAAQQARGAPAPKPPAKPAEFAPLPLKQAAAPRQNTAAQAPGPMPRPGSQLDIRV
jgi:hypothetical protein